MKIHEDIRKNAPPPGGHVFQATETIFEIVQYIIGTNLLSKFHDDRKINVASRVLTRKNATHPWRPYIIWMNHLTKFHEDLTINVASRIHIGKNAPPLGSPVFQANVTIFKLIQAIIGTNLLIKFHEDWTINVTPIVLTRKNAPPPGGHVFSATETIFELIQDSIGINLLTKFHEDWTINVACRVKNAPPSGGYFYDAWKINVASRVLTMKKTSTGSHVFQPTSIIFELVQYIIGMNLLTRFHKDWTIIVASIVKNAPPLGSHVF
ncbi:hypothetical protein DPMN_029258 [Dreissena polymorpha]|uniref:Uncharacterized protein n=1 Tax=Dreissena polymorpha TaxID=45954 RepID=A0A9D4M0G5_DREPO|nr:hypothetical protein DPMN_029258 [Dreissena polymorpha]